MEVTTDKIKELREKSGAGVMACRSALLEAEGDIERALECLRQKGLVQAKKKAERVAKQGLIESYIHPGGKIGVMIEVNCETDFVARTGEFKELAHNLAMQVAALAPQYISKEEMPEEADAEPQMACLLLQPYIKEPEKTIQDIITETIAKLGENIKVSRFARFELGV
ncbi:MAG: translation elongation factor Ts [Chloroflexi bacterium]|nr:translation elongation factor Ts [Chloroflexota bacterium]